MKPILISTAGRRVSLVRHFKQEADHLFGDNSRILACDLEPSISPACRIADDSFRTGFFNDENYVSNFIENCVDRDIGMIVPTVDTELLLLAENKSRFEQHGIQAVISSVDLVRACRDKRKTIALFEQLGINVPKAVDPSNPTFPLFVKPISGSSSKDVFVVPSPEHYSDYLSRDDLFVHQEVLDQKEFDEYTLDLYYCRNSNLKCVVPRKRIAVRGGEISKGITVKNCLIDFVQTHLSKLEGAVGCITLQLFLNRSTLDVFGIEINPRFGGGYPLSYAAGANYPRMLMQEYFLNKDIEYFDAWRENLLLLRYDNEMIIDEPGLKF